MLGVTGFDVFSFFFDIASSYNKCTFVFDVIAKTLKPFIN